MELEVEVVKIDVEGVERFDLRCETEVGAEIHNQSSVVSLDSLESGVQLPKFRFQFDHPSPHATLLFTLFKLGSQDPSTNTVKLGSALVPTTLDRGSTARRIFDRLPKQTEVALLGSEIKETGVSKYVGKVWFRVSHRSASRPLNLQSGFESGRLTSSSSFATLLSREAECVCPTLMPSGTGTLLVVFHSINSTSLSRTPEQLRPIACIGSSSTVKNDAIFHVRDGVKSTIPLLRPVVLRCNKNQTMELHVADYNDNSALFSAASPVSALTPFKHYNWQYTRDSVPGSDDAFSPSQIQDDKEPSVTVSLRYLPPRSEFIMYEGLELFISSVERGPAMDHKNIVLCTQLLSSDSKMRVQGINGYDIPFKRSMKKKSNIPDPLYNYNVSVVSFNPPASWKHSNPPENPAYFFFPMDPYFVSNLSGTTLAIHIFTADPSPTQPWWQTSLTASGNLDITPQMQGCLQLKANQNGVSWELPHTSLSQPSAQVVRKISGVVRWKSKQMQFLEPTIEALIPNLPKFHNLTPPQETEEEDTTEQESFKFDSFLPDMGMQLPFHNPESDSDLTDYRRAITQMAHDVMKLREENAMLRHENYQLHHQISQMEGAAAAVSSADKQLLESLSKADLIQRIVELQESLSLEAKATNAYQEKVQSLQNALIKKNDLEVQHIQLQEVHTTQQKLIRQLQSKVEKYRKCSHISRQQEGVITQLESLLAQQAQGHGNTDAHLLLSQQNAQLRAALRELEDRDPEHMLVLMREKDDTIQSLKAQLSKVTTRCQELEQELSEGSSSDTKALQPHHSSKVFELEQRLLIAHVHVDALMGELHENVRRWAAEKASYEWQLAQLKSELEVAQSRQQSPSLHTSHTEHNAEPGIPSSQFRLQKPTF